MRHRPLRPADPLGPVLGLLARIEAESAALPRPRLGAFWQRWRRLRRARPLHLTMVADPALLRGRPVVARTSADLVELAKLSTPDDVRFRAFYVRGGRGLAVKASLGSTRGARGRIDREVTQRRSLPDLTTMRVPMLHDHGQVGASAYLVEELVPGTVVEPAAQSQHVDRVLAAVEGLYRATARPPGTSELLDSATWERTQAFLQETKWARGWLPRRALAEGIAALVDDDPPMAIAMTHGDLVWSNLVIDGDTVGLVDWEWAGVRPVAADIAKLMMPVRNYGQYLGRLDALSRDLGVDTPFAAQWALALARSLGSAAHRAEVAREAGREARAVGRARKQVGMLSDLLRAL